MSDFVVAYILDDYKIGQRFTMWPLHVTVVPPFEVISLEALLAQIKPVTSSTKPIRAQPGEFRQLGKRTAQMLVSNPQLVNLHKDLLLALEDAGYEVRGRYTSDLYKPHITRKNDRDYNNTEFTIDCLQIVETLSQGYRQVVAELSLGAEDGQ